MRLGKSKHRSIEIARNQNIDRSRLRDYDRKSSKQNKNFAQNIIADMARGEEETKQFENLKLLKGPSTLRNISYIIELSLKNGGKNIIFMFLDNSIYEIT